MQLVYFWVEDYKCLKNFEINLSSKYEIHYDKENNKLDIKETPKKHQLFKNIASEYECINDLTAIVGKNGVGKTTIIRLLRDFYFRIYTNCIIVYLDNNQLYYGSDIDIQTDDKNIKNDYEKTIKLPDGVGIQIYDLFKEHVTICYSSVFDAMSLKINDRPSFMDLTTNKRLDDNDLIKYRNNFIQDCIKLVTTEDHLYHDIKEKIRFNLEICNIHCSLSNIDEELSLLLTYMSPSIQIRPIIYNPKYDNIRNTTKFKNSVELKKDANTIKEQEVYNFLITHIIRFMEEYYHNIKVLFSGKKADYFTSDKSKLDKILYFLNTIKADKQFKDEFQTIDNVLEIYNFLSKEENCNNNGIIPLDKVQELNNLIIKSSKKVQGSIWINLYDLSSGEVALINMYSRFYSLIHDKRIKEENKELTIFIDECDAYLHPEWQRRFMKDFFQMCKDLFPKKKINVILTTHSPIVLSDIPKGNVRFLDKDENGKVGVCEEQIDTFGANIYNLYKHAFFLNSNGSNIMGSLATEKINWAKDNINRLKNEVYPNGSLDDKDSKILKECSEIVSLIGEDIIKNYLQSEIDYINQKIYKPSNDNNLNELKQKYYNLDSEQKEDFIKYIIDTNKNGN